MKEWVAQAEKRVSDELKGQDATVRSRKKTLKWWCVFGLVTVRERIWRSQTKGYLRPLLQRLGMTPRGRSRRPERALKDFGCEHSFARATESVREHYGFEIGTSAVQTAAFKHDLRLQEMPQVPTLEPSRPIRISLNPEHCFAPMTVRIESE